MNENIAKTLHWSFWLIGAIALIWNGLGSVNFFVQMDSEMLANYRESERAIVEGRPIWATAAFAVAMFGGTIGALLLLLKKAVSFQVFLVSLAGVIVTQLHALTAGIDFGTGELLGVILMPVVVAVLLAWYSKFAAKQGWLN